MSLTMYRTGVVASSRAVEAGEPEPPPEGGPWQAVALQANYNIGHEPLTAWQDETYQADVNIGYELLTAEQAGTLQTDQNITESE